MNDDDETPIDMENAPSATELEWIDKKHGRIVHPECLYLPENMEKPYASGEHRTPCLWCGHLWVAEAIEHISETLAIAIVETTMQDNEDQVTTQR